MRYSMLIADPPWDYSNAGVRGAAENHYPTMTVEELCALPVGDLAADDAVLLLWATWPKLFEAAPQVIKAWGFEYVTGFMWAKLTHDPRRNLYGDWEYKPQYGTGFWVRGVTEPVLVCKRGNAKPAAMGNFCGIVSENFHHSRKPENLYEYAEAHPGPYLELFARRAREGWSVWGNEVERDVTLGAA